jgi:DNA-3-methyladenine glycosylase I
MARCSWCGTDPQYVAYHDDEWGVPVRDDVGLFNKLMLDAFQSGLSWLVVLRKREAIIDRLRLNDPERLARFTKRQIEAAMNDAAIIRNRAKIEASMANARLFCDLQSGGASFSELLWDHVDGRTIVHRFRSNVDIPARTAEGDAMAKHLKQLGFKWTGPTVCYAFMQAVGMVNDHVLSCPRWVDVQT